MVGGGIRDVSESHPTYSPWSMTRLRRLGAISRLTVLVSSMTSI